MSTQPRRVMLHGFAFTEAAVRSTHTALLTAGARPAGWMVHNNRSPSVAATLAELGVPVSVENPAPGHVEAFMAAPEPLELTGRQASDLGFLADREGHFDHEWDRSLFLARVDTWVQRVFTDAAPDLVVFNDVPHSAASYLLYLRARANCVPTALLRFGPTPFHFSYVDRVWAELAEFAAARAGNPALSEASEHQLARLRGTYDEAIPTYVADRTGWQAALRRARRRLAEADPRRVAAGAKGQAIRRALRQRYDARTTPTEAIIAGDAPIISLFLQLQPERTTTPEAGRFAQQWSIAQALAMSAPQGWRVVVREHPATFSSGPRLVRSTAFYDALAAFPNVSLAPVSMSPFDLADRSTFVATATGTVGFEAVARGGRTLAFGNASYLGCGGVTTVEHAHDVVTALSAELPGGAADAPDRFLAALDGSSACWVAPWRPDGSRAALRDTGVAYSHLLPRILDDRALR
ncbi:MAG: hypothetical protein JJU45_19260 [Acidimicrobiia bacterium]|nr:hypothetical protein [Acidimicrobiia bacterium]